MAAERKCGLIIGAAPWQDGRFLTPYLAGKDWMVFCADGGYANAKAAGLEPDFLIGDWDSGEKPALDVPCVTLPVEKDMTDLQAAMDEALSMGVTELLLCGCTGGRLDHEWCNLHLLKLCLDQGAEGILADPRNRVYLLNRGKVFRRGQVFGRYVSFLPFTERVTGITLTGFKYPLTDRDLRMGEEAGLCVSNELAADEAEIRFRDGILICVESRD